MEKKKEKERVEDDTTQKDPEGRKFARQGKRERGKWNSF